MLATILSVLLGFGFSAMPQTAPPLHIYWIDVEGGGATLLVTPAGESILVDAGNHLERDVSRDYDVATRVAGVEQIDYFIATHWHADHYGGAIKLSERLPIKRFYGNGPLADSVPDDPQFPVLMPLYRNVVKGQSTALKAGDTLPIRQLSEAPKLEVKVIASSRQFIAGTGQSTAENPECRQAGDEAPDPSENAKSLVLLITYGQFTFLDGGDLTKQMEVKMVCPVNPIGTVELFQINHHGLDLSNSPVLIHSIHPRVVVVNNGPMKGAEPKTMKTLFSTPGIETVWQVHRNLQPGAQLNTSAELIANQESDANHAAEYIQATAKPTGEFLVQIGSKGTSKLYPPR